MEQKISQRRFLQTTLAATAAVLTWEPVTSLGRIISVPSRKHLSLTGTWQVTQLDKDDWISATVPGCIHTDLLAAGKIPDPFYRDNEKSVQWISDADWLYRRTFDVPAEILSSRRVMLRCEGLDTLADIKINGQSVGQTDNMFRPWEFDVKSLLQTGQNSIEILFKSPSAYIKQHDSDQAPQKWVKGRAWLRKEPCSYGWDWGPVLASSGIWKNLGLETFDEGRITDVLVCQDHVAGKVVLNVTVAAESADAGTPSFQAVVTVRHKNKTVTSTTIDLPNGQGEASLEIKQPELWWAAGMGAQPLYDVAVDLMNAGAPIDTIVKRIGLRILKAVLPQGDSPLHFEVNGVPFFAKGANWIPADSFPQRVTPEIMRRYVADAAAVNMNVLRFWGGGYYEDDVLFDACDEMGICVWLDFKFACSAYPAFDENFMENVRQEAVENLRRLRHHPCIALWCGNNEISLLNEAGEWRDNTMSRADYDKLFKELLARQVQAYAPDANYVSGSPDCGDTHYWDVWHGTKTFDAYRTLNGFMSEFGYQSFPELRTVLAFTDESDRASVVTPVMKWHQRSGLGDVEGNQEMVDMIHRYFNAPKDFETTLWLSQILQGYGIKIGAEYWRQSMPKSMGCVFWQYNDIWPGMSWSSVDYFGRWKALHYLARRFYSPILVSGLEDTAKNSIDLFVTSDLLADRHGKLGWKITDLTGETLDQGSIAVALPARQSQKVKTLDLQAHAAKSGANNLLTWMKLEVDGQIVSENLVLLTMPKELKLADPEIKTSIHRADDGYTVTLKSKKPALWVWLGLQNEDARFSDNFVHLLPGLSHTITVRPAQPLSREDFAAQLRVRSLFDTYV